MIEISQYRIKIGVFDQVCIKKPTRNKKVLCRSMKMSSSNAIYMKLFLPVLLIMLLSCKSIQLKIQPSTTFNCLSIDLLEVLAVVPKTDTPNFKARYLY